MENLTDEITYVAMFIWKTSDVANALEALAKKYERNFGEIAEEYVNICDELGL